MPGFLLSPNTSIPESSEKAGAFNFFESVFAFLYAFSIKLLPFSFTLKELRADLINIVFSGHILLISLSLSLFEDAK